jgi:hypothetical protein
MDALYMLDRETLVQHAKGVDARRFAPLCHRRSETSVGTTADPRACSRPVVRQTRGAGARRGKRVRGSARARDQGCARCRAAANQRPRRCGARGGCAGVHVGWRTWWPRTRRLPGPSAVIGSLKTTAQARGATRSIDYVGIGGGRHDFSANKCP